MDDTIRTMDAGPKMLANSRTLLNRRTSHKTGATFVFRLYPPLLFFFDEEDDVDESKGDNNSVGQDQDSDDPHQHDTFDINSILNLKRGSSSSSSASKGGTSEANNNQPPQTPASHPLSVSSDFIAAIILSSDILFRRTNSKRFNRKMYLLTDGESRVDVQQRINEIGIVLDGVKKLAIEFTVIGLDFQSEGGFGIGTQLQAQEDNREQQKSKAQDGGDSSGEEEDDEDSSEDDYADYLPPEMIKSENEKLLMSIARETGGTVIAAKSLIELMQVAGAKKIPKSTRKKVSLQFVPGEKFEAVYSLLVSKANLQTLKTHAIVYDDDGRTIKDMGGRDVMTDIARDTSYRDSENPAQEVDPECRSKAYRYGNDYIPTNEYDEEALKMHGDIDMSVMGYIEKEDVPPNAYVGGGYAVTGGDSLRARTAISAMAQALAAEGKVALTRFVKSVDADPAIGVLLPMTKLEGEEGEGSHRLTFIQLPFAEDFTKYTFRSFRAEDLSLPNADITTLQLKTAEDYINSMILRDDEVVSHKIANPAIRSLNRTLIERIVQPNENSKLIIDVRKNGDVIIETPGDIATKARGAISDFERVCPLFKKTDKSKYVKKRFWSDISSDDK